MIGDFLADRKASVKIGKTKTVNFEIGRGVPQGTKLGPILYNIYTADIPTGTDSTSLIQYADDTAVFSQHVCPRLAVRAIKVYMTDILTYFNKWDISINESKTELITFRPKAEHCWKNTRKKAKNISLKIGDNTIRPSGVVKYLGVHFDEELQFTEHKRKAVRRAQIASGKLRPVTSRLSLDIRIKELLYKQVIRPVLSYGAPAWIPGEREGLSIIAVYERKIVRYITGRYRKAHNSHYYSNSELYGFTRIEPLHLYLKKLEGNFFTRAVNHPNSLISGTGTFISGHQDYNTSKELAVIWSS